MREYRARRIDNGEWVYGDLIKDNNDYYIKEPHRYSHTDTNKYSDEPTVKLSFFAWRVDIKTVGQYTGKNDLDGTKVFEGDFLSDNFGILYEVYYDNNEAGFILIDIEDKEDTYRFSEVEFEYIVDGGIEYKKEG